MRFFAAGSWEKDTENQAAVMSLKSFLLRDDFTLDSGINIPLRLLIFGIFSRGYGLITDLKDLHFTT